MNYDTNSPDQGSAYIVCRGTSKMNVAVRRGSKSGMLIMVEDNTVKKALVGLAIEKALLDIGRPVLDQVIRKLESEYHRYIFDCYENPEILHSVLREIYGNSYTAIIDSIKKNLEEFSHEEPISRFIAAISAR